MSKTKKKYYSLRSFFSYLSRYKTRFVVVSLTFMTADLALAIIPVFIGKLIGSLADQPIDHHAVLVYTALLLICSTGHDIVWRTGEFLFLKLFNPLSFRYENIVFRQVITQPYPYFVNKFTGKISSYITTLSQEFYDQIKETFWSYTSHLVSLVAVSIILTALNWKTGLSFIGGLVLMLVVGRLTVGNSVKYEQVWTDTQSTKNAKIIDAVANFVNVKSFQKEDQESRAIEREQDKTIQAANRSFVWGMVFWGSQGFVMRNIIWPGAILLNIYLFLDHQINLAELTTFLSAVVLFSSYIWEIVWSLSQFTLKLARMEEAYIYLFGTTNIVADYYTRRRRIDSGRGMQQQLSLRGLHFAYPDQPQVSVVNGIDLDIKKGEKIGIVGKSGSGKTTLTKLLLDYYQAENDQILLDGSPINTRDLSSLISYVPQDTSLFHRSVADNIAYATDREVTRADVIAAAKQAHADEFIAQISDGYDALVGERGVKLSAGQRQRIAIARAFLDDRPILVLDEATSALDSESEMLVQEALEALWQHKTVIAIAHRLSTLRHMDRIIVIDKGKIVEQGSHQDLMRQAGRYAKLWAHQSGGFLAD